MHESHRRWTVQFIFHYTLKLYYLLFVWSVDGSKSRKVKFMKHANTRGHDFFLQHTLSDKQDESSDESLNIMPEKVGYFHV